MQRRVFVRLSAFTAAVLTLPLVPGCKSGKTDIESQPLFFSQFADPNTIGEAGKAYLAIRPDEKDIGKLKNLILAKQGPVAGDKATGAALHGRIKNDFSTSNIVTVNGWVLSATEARQCALFYLLRS